AAHALEQRIGADAAHLLGSLGAGDRCKPEGDILEHFDIDAAKPEHNQRAELRVAVDAHQHLAALAHLLLYQHTPDRRLAAVLARAVLDQLVAVARRCRIGHTHAHATNVALMQNVGYEIFI